MSKDAKAPGVASRIGVVVKVFGAHRARFGPEPRRVEIPTGGTLRDVLAELDGIIPTLSAKLQEGLDHGYLQVLVNGRNAEFLDRLDSKLEADDTVAFLPPIGGG